MLPRPLHRSKSMLRHEHAVLNSHRQAGFTLVEVAIVIVIVGLLLGGAVLTLSAQMDLKNNAETAETLRRAQDALLGFAAANGRLPCPAIASGQEALNAGTGCTTLLGGFVPATTLGIGPTDAQGFLIDAWGNRIRYAVTLDLSFTSRDIATQLQSLGTTALVTRPSATDAIVICSVNVAAAPSEPANCPAGPPDTTLSNRAVAVFHSTGENGVNGASPEEQTNIDGGRFFVDHTPTPAYDDQVLWVSRYTLSNRMIAAGAL